MATSTGKTLGLLVLIFVILLPVLFFAKPFFFMPFFGLPAFSTGTRLPHIIPSFFTESFVRWAFLFTFALLILWIAIIIWVYRDAEQRNMNGVLWALLVFVGNLVGLLIYLIMRTDSTPRQTELQSTQLCPKCEKTILPRYTFCPRCGTRLRAVCPSCKESVANDWQVCPHCGEKLA